MFVSKKASIDVGGTNGLRRGAKDGVRPQAFFLLGQQRIDQLRLRRRLAGAHQFANRASEMRTVIARLAAMGVSSYDSTVVLSHSQAVRPASAAAEHSAATFGHQMGTENSRST